MMPLYWSHVSLKEHSTQEETSGLTLLNVGRKNAASILCAGFLLRTDLQGRKGTSIVD